ncbi:acyl-coenzyme A thioesterase 1-like [Genypterus blacodes]|uniref:acyl-coenzyme A thioesterase 1-like n=1 Tax=Genypterus blacodes TaxID=154954 RepID=UPI003F76EE98
MASLIRLRLLPRAKCLFDEPIQVKVAGLRSKQLVTMKATATDDRAVIFTSSATYRADDCGEVDLQRDPSLRGSYVGVEPMGLLWSMRPNLEHGYFYKKNALSSHLVRFSVHEGEDEGGTLAEATNERLLIGEGVTRLPVKEGNIKGALFTPPGAGPFPAVLDVSSFKCEKRASLLANKGFVVLSVAVYNDKSENVTKVQLDYFKEAIDFLKQQPKVGSKGVGLLSRSKAADVALSMASYLSGVEAVIWINGCSANAGLPLYYQQRQIHPALMFDYSKLIHTQSDAWMIKYGIHDHLAEENRATLIPIEKAKGHFLFVAAEDDLNWDSKAYMEEMVERLESHGKKNFETVSYPGAGHMLEPPYGPYCPSSPHGVLRKPVLWGGKPKVHAAAEVHLWKKIQEFFRAHIHTEGSKNKAELENNHPVL